MTAIAAENNLSETCFVSPLPQSSGEFGLASEFNLRWFTPKKEVALCGHGTLAVAAAIFSPSVGNPNSKLTFHTLSGPLAAARSGVGGNLITLDFPMNAPRVVATSDPDFGTLKGVASFFLAECGGAEAFEIEALAHCLTTKKLLVHAKLRSNPDDAEAAQRALEALHVPAVDRLLAHHTGEVVTGISLVVAGAATSVAAETGYHFCSRYFSPW